MENGCEASTSYVRYDNGEWLAQSVTTSDFLGRVVTSSRAGTGGVMLTTSNVYNNAGILVQSINHDNSSVVYAYDELNERVATIRIGAGQTLDFDPQSFTLAGVIALDKYMIDETTESTELIEGEWWRCATSASYKPGENVLTASVQRVQLTGLTPEFNSRSISTDANGITTINTESVNPTSAAKVAKSVDITFNTTNISYSVAGYETCSSNSLSSSSAYIYDGFARRVRTTNNANGRELKSVMAYHDDGSLATVGEITASGTNTTSYSTRQAVAGKPGAYKITVTDAIGNQTVNYYSGDGELYRSEGATYPTETARDAAGRMSELHTWRDESGNSDITRWYYDPFTGAVTNELYADGNGTAYTYLSDGRMATRTWARDIITTYGYADTAAGSIRTTEYSDTTPSVTNSFNLAGQLIQIQDGTGTTTFGYDVLSRQIAETNALAVITRSYDTYGRYSQFVLDPVYPEYPCFIVQYGYDIYNRLNTITASVGSETNTFTYSYISGTQLICGYTVETGGTASPLSVSRTYESYRNLIASITNAWNTSVISSFDYSNDSTGKRTERIDAYNGSTITNYFDYNIRNEVTNAVMNSSEQSIVYDDIGNRLQSTVDSDQLSVTNTYTANQLNQYMAIRTNGIYRSISHDQDGNLRNDGYWIYSWNAENRPTEICHSLYEATNDDIRVEIKYDYQNRRFERKITKFRMTVQDPMTPYVDGVWDPVRTHKYIWDGYNIAAEIIIDHVTPSTNISFYTWGIDLSGTLQGAGGVGGLLSDTKVSSTGTNVFYSVSDGNGNITEYIDDTGTVKAHGEHNAFGKTELSGSMKDDFTHWFSSKPLDAETGLVSYELRYLKPGFAWLSRDPIGELGGINVYAFGENDGINKFDILGQFNLPNSWLVGYADMLNQAQYSKIWFLLLAEIRGRFAKGGDPWLRSFLFLCFFGDGSKTVILTKDDVSQIKETNPSLWLYSEEFKTHSGKKAAFMGHKVINEKQSNRRFEVITQGGGTGNDTLGHFDVYYKGEVKNCTFKGHYKIKDDFSFHWDWKGGRSIHGEALVELFSLYFHGVKFNIESEWIFKTEKWGKN